MVEIRSIEAGNRVFTFQRRNLYPFITKEDIESWMNDEGPLRVRWFEARNEEGKRIGIDGWEIYDLHQYKEGGPIYLILDLLTMDIDAAYRGQGVGKTLFIESLMETISQLEGLEKFLVGGLQIETHTAVEFYRKTLRDFGELFWNGTIKKEWWKEEKRFMAGDEFTVFWARLIQ